MVTRVDLYLSPKPTLTASIIPTPSETGKTAASALDAAANLNPYIEEEGSFEEEEPSAPANERVTISSRLFRLEQVPGRLNSPYTAVVPLADSDTETTPVTGKRGRSDSANTITQHDFAPSPSRWLQSTTPRADPTLRAQNPPVLQIPTPVSIFATHPLYPPAGPFTPTPAAPRRTVSNPSSPARTRQPRFSAQPLFATAAPQPTAPTQPPRVSTPTPPTMAQPQEMHWARERLDKIEPFNGKELTTKQVESIWRKKFVEIVEGYNVNDKQKLTLWKECVDVDSPAAEWKEQMDTDSKIGTWAELVTQLEARWPAPDESEKRKEKSARWYRHAFDESKMGTMVDGAGGNAEPYYVVWAREHMALAADMGSEELTKVEYTWHQVLPGTLKGLLPKGLDQYKTVSSLCKDVMRVDQDRVLAWIKPIAAAAALQERDQTLAALVKRMSLMESQALAQQAAPSRAQNQVRTNSSPAANAAAAAPRQQAAQRSNTPVTQAAAQSPSQSGNAGSRPQGPSLGRGKTFEDTPVGRAQYQSALAARPANSASLWQYPLAPGTYQQTAKLCPRCGRGNHDRSACRGNALEEREIEWRTRVKEQLTNDAAAQAGAPMAKKPLFQILVDGGYSEEEAVQMQALMESGNGMGQ